MKRAEMEQWVSGTGQRVLVHPRNASCDDGCAIHNPTDPHVNWPQHWRDDRQLMERLCPHGVGHPDVDHMNFVRKARGEEFAKLEGAHGCDGCCGLPPEPTGWGGRRLYAGGYLSKLAEAGDIDERLDALLAKVTRFEVIDHSTKAASTASLGRVYSEWDISVDLSFQDGGRTLKVFVDDQ